MRPEYAGNYSAPDGQKLTFRAEQNHLIIMYNGQPIALEKRGRDRFLCPHPDFSLFLLHFTRDKGGVTEASYGSQWYANDRYTGPRQFQYPPAWNSYPGHYRTSTRHPINFRIGLRKGKLLMIGAGGDENPLGPAAGRHFSTGQLAGMGEFCGCARRKDSTRKLLGHKF